MTPDAQVVRSAGPMHLLDRVGALPFVMALALLASIVMSVSAAASDRPPESESAVVDVDVDLGAGRYSVVDVTSGVGTEVVDLMSPEPSLLAALDRSEGSVEGLAVAYPGIDRVELNAVSTAATIVYWSTGIKGAVSDPERLARLGLAVVTPEFETLVATIATSPSAQTAIDDGVAEVIGALVDKTASSCGLTCDERLSEGVAALTSSALWPVELWSVEGEGESDSTACAEFDSARIVSSAGLELTAKQALSGSMPSSRAVDRPVVQTASAVAKISECGEVVDVRAVAAASDVLSPSEDRLLRLVLGEDFPDVPEGGLADVRAALGDGSDPYKGLIVDLLLRVRYAPSPFTLELEPFVPPTTTTTTTVAPSTTTTTPPTIPPTTIAPATTAPPTSPPTTSPPTTVAPVTIPPTTTVAPIVKVRMLSQSQTPPATGEWTLHVTVENSGNVAVTAAAQPWSLIDGSGASSPLAVDPQLRGGFVIEAGASLSGAVTFTVPASGGSPTLRLGISSYGGFAVEDPLAIGGGS